MHLKMPKYEGKQSVVAYLELFEEVAEQNQYPDSEWLIRLRIAVAGSKLGTTPEKAWKTVTQTQQQADESFHQFVGRIGRAVSLWSKLTVVSVDSEEADSVSIASASSLELEPIQEALVKQVVLGASSAELRAFMLERKCYTLSLGEFQTTGMAYQEAHGRKMPTKKQGPAETPKYQATAQCMQISVQDVAKKMQGMTLDERIEYAKTEKLCWNCFKTGHRAGKCYSSTRCSTCSKRHHSLLHIPVSPAAEKSPSKSATPAASIKAEEVNLGTYECGPVSKVRLMTGVGRVQTVTKSARVRMFLDTGAQASFISAELVAALKPELLGKEMVKVKAFGTEPVLEPMERYRLTIKGKTKPVTITAWKKESLDMEYDIISEEVVEQWRGKGVELSDRSIPDVPKAVHVLIGADHCNDIISCKKEVNGESAWDTEIGWVLSGPVKKEKSDEKSVIVRCVELDRLWQLEDIPQTSTHLPDFPIEKSGNSYQVGLLWRSERRPPDNLPQAMATAQALLNKLERQGKRKEYDSVLMSEYTKLDAIEKELEPGTPGYYLPHHAVFKKDSTTTKTRVVFNASASMEAGKSLNDMVDPGPSLLPDLAGLLLRFREYPCAVQADIRKAFFMIGMREEDRPYLRFVWPEVEKEEMCIWRLKKLPFGVNCSPFILNAVLQAHLECMLESASEAESAVIKLLLRSFYVDDFITSVANSTCADHLQDFSVSSLQGAGMELRKWRGNTIRSDPDSGSKALGIVWNNEDDIISVASVDVSGTFVWSRRVLLKCVASVFDPLGFVCPSVLVGKMLLQECWKLGGGWDDPLPDDLSARCTQWWGACVDVSNVRVPRWIGCHDDSVVALHMFADASEKGYGCCMYVVVDSSSSLLFAKAKVAPVSPPTIARLELQAVHLASRVLRFVVGHLRINVGSIVGWTDSLTTWHWIMSPAYRWKTYVANRVSLIQDVAKELKVEWRHVPGVSNPADLASRGAPPTELQSDFWQHGPEWLVEEAKWPQPVQASASTQESVVEARVMAVNVEVPLDWQWERFSKWRRARGVVARILWLAHKEMSRAELCVKAEAVMYRALQADCFSDELTCTRSAPRKHPSVRRSASGSIRQAPLDHTLARAGSSSADASRC